jgi:hypothetical protein
LPAKDPLRIVSSCPPCLSRCGLVILNRHFVKRFVSKKASEDFLSPLIIFLTRGGVPAVEAIELHKLLSKVLNFQDSAYFNTA